MYRSILVIALGVLANSLTLSGQQPLRPGAGSAARTAPAPRPVGAARSLDPRILPGTKESAFTTIQGNALDSTGASMPKAAVRLRDARSGRIMDTLVTDDSGMFTFRSVDPGSYIVEILGNNQTILAASQLLSVNAGDAIAAVVKLPFRIPPFAGFLGHTTQSAVAVAASAASAGMLGVTANECVSPPCGN